VRTSAATTGEIVEDMCRDGNRRSFELNPCDATRKAANMGGFKESPLLQEPAQQPLRWVSKPTGEAYGWSRFWWAAPSIDRVIKSWEGTVHVGQSRWRNFLGGVI